MNCPMCGQPMEIYQSKTTYDKQRNAFDHKRYRCRKDNVWSRLGIPQAILNQRAAVSASPQ
jgi:hypothetical protein